MITKLNGKEYNLTISADVRDFSIAYFTKVAKEKYDKGQKEHGGLIWNRDNLQDLFDESIDVWFYTIAAIIRRESGKKQNIEQFEFNFNDE